MALVPDTVEFAELVAVGGRVGVADSELVAEEFIDRETEGVMALDPETVEFAEPELVAVVVGGPVAVELKVIELVAVTLAD